MAFCFRLMAYHAMIICKSIVMGSIHFVYQYFNQHYRAKYVKWSCNMFLHIAFFTMLFGSFVILYGAKIFGHVGHVPILPHKTSKMKKIAWVTKYVSTMSNALLNSMR